jgi:peptidase E
MSQLDALRGIDGLLMDAFRTAGFADDAVFTPLAGASVACRVYVDRGNAVFEQFGVEVVGDRIVVGIMRMDVNRPEAGSTLAIGSETFRLEDRIASDESLTRWVVAPV